MGLTRYKEKRDFKKSPEPQGGKPGKEGLRFVVQKHAASHLHYDFRLEMEGVLKSWAVPKGPSLDPSVKRLAMMVEDHPYDYRNFEGIIPSGYGAGTVIIWDEGTYEPVNANGESKKELDKELRKQLHAGKLKFILRGSKLKGEFALVKAHGRGENGWLLMKVNDKYATDKDVTLKNKSVISKKTLEQVEKTSTNYWGNKSSEKKDRSEKSPAKKNIKPAIKKEKKSARTPVKKKPESQAGNKAPFPSGITPMLATLVDKAVDQEGWVYEVKWDGYRALSFSNKGKVELKSRNNKSFDDKFYPVHAAVSEWGINAVVDGEIVVVNEKGISDFGALQNWRSEADGELIFYLFDLLWLEGRDLTGLPLMERRKILKEIIPGEGIIRYSEAFSDKATDFFKAAKDLGLEGIIAKKADSQYYPGLRTKDWLKIKANKRQEVVIGGYTVNDDTSKPFSALMVGVFKDGQLVYTGKVGTGFNIQAQKDMLKQFKPLVTNKPPFNYVPDINKPSRFRPDPPNAVATWLKPKLVCEVSFTEMTSDGIMRHPSFQGMRIDKNAKDVILEKEMPAKKIVKSEKTFKSFIMPADTTGRKSLLNPTDETQVRKVNGHELKFTNLSKIFWPKEKVTKRDVLNYYYQVAPFMLPYLNNRPQSLNRHPHGINGESFYQKDVTGKAPPWVKTYLYHSEADKRDKHFLVCTNEASLLYMASLGCIEINPWSSTVKKPDHPDWCIIDLDPANNTFDQVVEAALVTKQVLDSFGIPSCCKTSGSTGLHIYIPLGAKYTYEESKEFARVIARMVHQELPGFTSIERTVKNRGGKMYIDFLQNRSQATLAAPYSIRPKPGAPVSMPLHWEEVKKGIKITDFNIFNAMDRLKNVGDIFKPVLGPGINLKKIMKQF
jgi:bifunctional non-homologous end joining protein LigD